MEGNARRGALVLGMTLALGAMFAAAAGGGNEAATLPCPDPSKRPIGKIYGKNRGTTWCNNGATATATVAGVSKTFAGGVCWTDANKTFRVDIGTGIAGKRLATDPAGFALQDVGPKSITKDTVSLGFTKAGKVVSWGSAPVTLKLKPGKVGGSWSGKQPKLVGGKLTYVPASGTFSCGKGILNVPF